MELNRQEKDSNNGLETKLINNLGLGLRQNIQSFIKLLSERLEKMEKILVIDKIEGNIAICENRKNGEIENIEIARLPENIREGTILKWKNGRYEIDGSGEIEQRIKQKMKDVWK